MNTNLTQIIASNSIEHNKKLVKSTNCAKCSPCFLNTRTVSRKQVIGITSFKNTQTKRQFDIFHNITAKVSGESIY